MAHYLYSTKPRLMGRNRKFTVQYDVKAYEYEERGNNTFFIRMVSFKEGDVFWGVPKKPPVSDRSAHIRGHTNSLYRFADDTAVVTGNPKRNPVMAKQMMTVGTLLNVEIVPSGSGTRVTKRSFKNKYLLWDGRNFHIAKRTGNSSAKLNGALARKHKKFHETNATGTMAGEIPDQTGKLSEIGLIKALTYAVPRSIKSPGKNPYTWHHAFGDTGHKGGDNYPKKVMPSLMQDEVGNLFIKRRKGNIFKVDTWLRG